MTEQPPSQPVCCCQGVAGNTVYRCLARALDLGHCTAGSCPYYKECKAHGFSWVPDDGPEEGSDG